MGTKPYQLFCRMAVINFGLELYLLPRSGENDQNCAATILKVREIKYFQQTHPWGTRYLHIKFDDDRSMCLILGSNRVRNRQINCRTLEDEIGHHFCPVENRKLLEWGTTPTPYPSFSIIPRFRFNILS